MRSNELALCIILGFSTQVACADAEFVDQARVLSTVPQIARVNLPRQQCHTEYVQESIYPQSRSNTGAVVGGVAGGLLGSTVGRGTGRIAAAALGAGLGAIVGDRVDNQNSSAQTVTKPVQQCVTVDQWQMVTTGYLVNYEYQGRRYTTVLDKDPGPQLGVVVSVKPQYQTGAAAQSAPPPGPTAWQTPGNPEYPPPQPY